MPKECAKCKQKANIQINVINYCNECFLKNTTAKAAKILNGMPHDSPILVYANAMPSAVAVCDILQEFFAIRKYYRVIVCHSGPEAQSRLSSAAEHINLRDLSAEGYLDACPGGCAPEACAHCRIGLPHCITSFAKANHIKTIVYAKTLEDILSISLGCICSGDGSAAVATACVDNIGGVTIINPLGVIRDKELIYYLHIKGLARPHSALPQGKIDAILRDFLHETDSRNSLALFNILSTLKKLG